MPAQTKGRGRARGRPPPSSSPSDHGPAFKEPKIGGKPGLDPAPLQNSPHNAGPFDPVLAQRQNGERSHSPGGDSGISERIPSAASVPSPLSHATPATPENQNRYTPENMSSGVSTSSLAASPSEDHFQRGDSRQGKESSLVLPAKPGRGKEGTPITVWSNLFEVQMEPNARVFRYFVDVHQMMGGRREKNLTKGASNEYFRLAKQMASYRVLRQVVKENKEYFGRNIYGLIYDRRNTLYTRESLVTPPDGKKFMDISLKLRPDDEVEPENNFFCLTLTETDQYPIDLGDLTRVTTRDMGDFDRSLQQFVEVITSQIIYDNDDWVGSGAKFYRKRGKMTDVGSGRELGDGIVKSSKPIEGNGNGPTMAIILDNKKTAFFKPQNAINTLMETLKLHQPPTRLQPYQAKQFQNDMKDLSMKDVVTGREFVVFKLTEANENALNIKKSFRDPRGIEREMTVKAFYNNQLGKNIEFPQLPLFVERTPKKDVLFHPMEFCDILPHQSVPINKQTPEQMQQMIRQSALKPSDNLNQLKDKVQELKLMDKASNHYLAELGSVVAKPIEVTGRIRPQPEIRGHAKVLKPDFKGEWKPDSMGLFKVGVSEKWALVNMDNRMQPRDIEAFVDAYYQVVKQNKIHMKPLNWKENFYTCTSPEGFPGLFKQMEQHHVDFAFFILQPGMQRTGKDLLKLHERDYQILTQCIKSNKAREVSGYKGRQLLCNLVLKTNPKLGGINYEIELSNKKRFQQFFGGEKTMILGCDVTHPPPTPRHLRHLPAREPSIVGFVGNRPDRPSHYTGEVAVQNPREEVVEGMRYLAGEMIRRWQQKSQGGKLPQNVFYFRDGVSEGQFEKVVKEEVESIKDAFRKECKGPIPKFLAVVCIKRHHERLYRPLNELNPRDNAVKQDLPVGTVVDTTIIHANRFEFFLKPHVALQGTAKPLKVTCILNEVNVTEDELEDITYALCHGHQIVCKAVSLPSPVYGAHEMAERGKRLYKAYCAMEEEGSQASDGSRDSGLGERSWAEITERIKVADTILATRKHWA